MPQPALLFRVLIASPGDLAVERRAASDAIHDWNALHATDEGVVLLPVKWETHATPRTGASPQQAINEELVQTSDILVGMFWTRIGTKTAVAESGTVEEIDQFVTSGRPALLYSSTRRIDPNKIDLEQMGRLRDFTKATRASALFGTFKNTGDLKAVLVRDLTRQVRLLKKKAQQGTPAPSEPSSVTKRPAAAGISPKRVPSKPQYVLDTNLLRLFQAFGTPPRPKTERSIDQFQKVSRDLDAARAQIAKLEGELKGKKRDQALADQLTMWYRAGVTEILNAPPIDASEMAVWREREAQWTNGVLATMRENGCTLQELNHVEIIGLFPLLPLHNDKTIAKDLSMFAVRLQRVADISTKYAAG